MRFGVVLALALGLQIAHADHPVVVYSQKLPEPPIDLVGVAVDSSGNAYVVQGNVFGGGAYVSKVNASGWIWTVRIGGASRNTFGAYFEEVSGVAVDQAGNVYVVGNTSAADFPTLTAMQSQPVAASRLLRLSS